MGHVHFRKSLVENNITFLCPCLGYKREWRTADIYSEMNHALIDFCNRIKRARNDVQKAVAFALLIYGFT